MLIIAVTLIIFLFIFLIVWYHFVMWQDIIYQLGYKEEDVFPAIGAVYVICWLGAVGIAIFMCNL